MSILSSTHTGKEHTEMMRVIELVVRFVAATEQYSDREQLRDKMERRIEDVVNEVKDLVQDEDDTAESWQLVHKRFVTQNIDALRQLNLLTEDEIRIYEHSVAIENVNTQ